MNEIKRYNSWNGKIYKAKDGVMCSYRDIAPIIQRNAELEAEIARLREQNPVGKITDKGIDWEDSFFTNVVVSGDGNSNLYAEPKPAQIPDELARLRGQEPIQAVPISFDEVQKWALENWRQHLPDEEAYKAYREAHDQKPAPAIPDELVAWASKVTDRFVPYDKGYDDAREFVREQLDKIKGKS